MQIKVFINSSCHLFNYTHIRGNFINNMNQSNHNTLNNSNNSFNKIMKSLMLTKTPHRTIKMTVQ